jgi:predicted metal-dependent phosphoesterase TrpH
LEASAPQLVLAPDAAIDLQLHTIYSDGTWTPEQLIEYLVGERFGLAAITDHDRIDTVASLQQLATEKQLPLLAAVEMSTSWKGELTDILCYGFDPEQNALRDLAQDIARRQRENTREICENLRKIGYEFPNPHELVALLKKPSAQHPHELAAVLKSHGYGTGEPSAGKLITDAGFFWATNDIATVVDAAHRSGAVCLIAHPGRGEGYTIYDAQLLDELCKDVPIDGFEVYYPAHTPEQITMYLEYANIHRLLTSSGSDSHGPQKKPIKYRAETNSTRFRRDSARPMPLSCAAAKCCQPPPVKSACHRSHAKWAVTTRWCAT